jgi:hypothetical protein
VAHKTLAVGDIAFIESPLAALADPCTLADVCHHCFLLLGPSPVRCSSSTSGSQCNGVYCSTACRDSAKLTGHGVLCGATGSPLGSSSSGDADAAAGVGAGGGLDDFCAHNRLNFPRVAAAMLAKSLSSGHDFVAYWSTVNALAHAPPGPEESWPRQWHTAYGLVRSAVSSKMGGEVRPVGSSAYSAKASCIRAGQRLL